LGLPNNRNWRESLFPFYYLAATTTRAQRSAPNFQLWISGFVFSTPKQVDGSQITTQLVAMPKRCTLLRNLIRGCGTLVVDQLPLYPKSDSRHFDYVSALIYFLVQDLSLSTPLTFPRILIRNNIWHYQWWLLHNRQFKLVATNEEEQLDSPLADRRFLVYRLSRCVDSIDNA
jgi:hypothetical protein